MTGKEIIEQINAVKMPDREKVRNYCLNNAEISLPRHNRLLYSLAACACGLLLIAGTVFGASMLKNKEKIQKEKLIVPDISSEAVQGAENGDIDKGINNDGAVEIEKKDNKTDNTGTDKSASSTAKGAASSTAGRASSKAGGAETPTGGSSGYSTGSSESGKMDEIIIYNDRIYTMTQTLQGQEYADKYAGDWLGYALGWIEEKSDDVDYEQKYFSTVEGDIYAVNGYNADFRICILDYSLDDGNATIPCVKFFENLTDYNLNSGSNLLLDLNNLKENWVTVKYQTFENWSQSSQQDYVYNDLQDVTAEDISAFLAGLNKEDFQNFDEPRDEFFYSNENRARLCFELNDGRKIHLMLLEGGYVGNQEFSWYFAKLPPEIFDKIFNACTVGE